MPCSIRLRALELVLATGPVSSMQTIFVGGYLKCGTSVPASTLCSGNDVNPMIGEVVHLHGITANYRTSLELFDLHSRDYFDDRKQ